MKDASEPVVIVLKGKPVGLLMPTKSVTPSRPERFVSAVGHGLKNLAFFCSPLRVNT